MPNPSKRDLTAALKALAHPSRLAAVRALGSGELCVCELQAVMGSDLSTVSRHVKLLADAGLVASRREGKWIHCRLAAPCVLEFLNCLESGLRGEACVGQGQGQPAGCVASVTAAAQE